jgi:hypothetical protein
MTEDVLEFVANNKKNQKQKKSIFFEYKEEIFYMLDNDIQKKDIHNFLVEKYNIQEVYSALTRWINRHYKNTNTNVNNSVVTKKTLSSKELYNS